MRKYLLPALGAALALMAPVGAMAQQQHKPGASHQQQAPVRQQPAKQQAPAQHQSPAKPAPRPAVSHSPYGTWNNSWGAKPSAPPSHFAKKGDWYNSRTDTYRTVSGKSLRCKL